MKWVRGDVCVWWGRRKKKDRGIHEWWGKRKGYKKEKRNGSGVYVYGEKKGGVEKKEEKNLTGKKLN